MVARYSVSKGAHKKVNESPEETSLAQKVKKTIHFLKSLLVSVTSVVGRKKDH